MSRHRARSGRLRVVATCGGLAVAGSVVAVHVALGVSAAPVLSDSMRPAYQRGDLVITRLEPSTRLQVGEIAVFTPPGMSAPVAHRIVALDQTPAGSIAVSTKGDANPARDSWHAVLHQTRVPVVVGTVPRVGSVLIALDADAAAVRAGIVGLLGLALTAVATVVAARRSRQRQLLTGGTAS